MYSSEFLIRYAKDRISERQSEAATARLRPRSALARALSGLAERQNADLASTMTLPQGRRRAL